MKLCIDCKFYDGLQEECCHNGNIAKSPVNGKSYSRQSAHYLRMEGNSCGTQAKWFEPKEPTERSAA